MSDIARTTDPRGEGQAAHVAWEAVRGDENECEAERRIREEETHTVEWWNGWLDRSDDWRDQMGYTAGNGW